MLIGVDWPAHDFAVELNLTWSFRILLDYLHFHLRLSKLSLRGHHLELFTRAQSLFGDMMDLILHHGLRMQDRMATNFYERRSSTIPRE
jgi:hypothetical protein